MGNLWLADAFEVVHRAELAEKTVRIFDFTADNLTFTVNACHQVLRWVQISAQDALFMFIQRKSRSILDPGI
jgi:hypothetical protein